MENGETVLKSEVESGTRGGQAPKLKTIVEKKNSEVYCYLMTHKTPKDREPKMFML